MGFPDDVVYEKESDLVKGKFPSKIHINVERIASKDVPIGDQQLREWLEKRWQKKEDKLSEFHKLKSFTGNPWPNDYNRVPQWIGFFIWTFLIGT